MPNWIYDADNLRPKRLLFGAGIAVSEGNDYISIYVTGSSSVPTFISGSVPFANSVGILTEDNVKFVFDNTNKRLMIGSKIMPNIGGATFPGRNLLLTNVSGSAGEITVSFGGVPFTTLLQANGTQTNPTGTLLDNIIGVFSARGYGQTQFADDVRAGIYAKASENWNDTKHGTYFTFGITPTGSTVIYDVAKLYGDGLAINGNLNLTGSLFGNNITLVGGLNINTTGAGKGSFYLQGTGTNQYIFRANNINGDNRGGFQLQSDGTYTFDIRDTGSIQSIIIAGQPGYFWARTNSNAAGVAGFIGGLSGDVQLYRGATDTWTTPDSIQIGGSITQYKGVTTVGAGVPSEVATVDLTGQNATINTTTLYAVPAGGAGMYQVNWYAKVTTVAGVSSQLGPLRIDWTDATDSVAQNQAGMPAEIAASVATSNSGNTTSAYLMGFSTVIWAKASTNITYAMTYVSNAAAAMIYELHIKLEYLG